MAFGNCQICLSNFPLKEFLSLPCGHCFCRSCLDGVLAQSSRSKCPNCRTPIRRGDGHQIFLDIVDEKVALATIVIDGLNQMDAQSRLISVKRAGDKMQMAADIIQAEGDIADALGKAIKDFKERIIPLFEIMEEQSRELMIQREDLEEARKRNSELQVNVKELARMRRILDQTENERDQAIILAESAKNEVVKLRDSDQTCKQSVAELQRDNRNLRDQLDRHSNATRAKQQKIRGLKQQVSQLTAQINAQADPQLFEESMSIVTNTGYESTPECESDTRSGHVLSHAAFPASSGAGGRAHRDCEAMPRPGFGSEWQINKAINTKRKLGKVREDRGKFPIELDKKGHPMVAVQLGPKRLRHVHIK